MEETPKCKSVFSPGIARTLIKEGKYRLLDIKPNKENKDRTIFLFEKTPEFTERLQELIEERKSESELAAKAGIDLGVM